MKRIVVLLGGPVSHDSRVIRSVRTASRLARVTLVCLKGREDDRALFGEGVELRAIPPAGLEPRGLRRHLLLHRHFDAFAPAAQEGGDRYDVVWANDFPTLMPAARISRACGARLLYDSHEIYLETLNQFYAPVARFPRSAAFRLLVATARRIGRRYERCLARTADLFLTTNESYAAHFRRAYGLDRVEVVRNCPERVACLAGSGVRDALSIPSSERIILYEGMMNHGRGLSELVLAARHLPPGATLVLLGSGPLEADLRALVRARGLSDRVRFLPPVPPDVLVPFIASADLGALVLDPVNESKRLASANKVFEYMAAGLPLLLTDLPENRRILTECDSGTLLAGRTPEAIAAGAAEALRDEGRLGRHGENGRRAHLERYNWDVEGKRLRELLEGLLGT
jgi:glycosyltransferase involved in cell wall biosynthesis